MDAITLEGYGVFISALIVFCGSIWLLLAVVLGSRLAYFITASVTLAFVLIMGTVWSFTQLGPVGVAPSWSALGVGEEPAEIDFSGAGSYPEGDWRPPDADDEEDVTHASEAEGAASEALTAAIEEDEITTFEPEGDEAAIDPLTTVDSTRLLELNDKLYGATLFQAGVGEDAAAPDPAQVGDPETVLVVVEFDPGDPYGLPRKITLGVLILFVLHLVGLSRAERKAKGVEVTA
ncbi:MAG: hypothetical protein GEU71_08365 [Actinobacteria bacterium]|nr:hypothetical protein [Actinomycetota bacterium]